MSRSFVLPLTAALCLSTGAFAADFYPWRNHEAPFDFVFGNDIDTHQQTRQARDGSLFGFFYVAFTGVVTKDRYPVATHVDCNSNPGCTVGWTLSGKPMSATFLYQVMHDHPVFLVSRQDIPQPGAHSHFHWLGPVTPLPPARPERLSAPAHRGRAASASCTTTRRRPAPGARVGKTAASRSSAERTSRRT